MPNDQKANQEKEVHPVLPNVPPTREYPIEACGVGGAGDLASGCVLGVVEATEGRQGAEEWHHPTSACALANNSSALHSWLTFWLFPFGS